MCNQHRQLLDQYITPNDVKEEKMRNHLLWSGDTYVALQSSASGEAVGGEPGYFF